MRPYSITKDEKGIKILGLPENISKIIKLDNITNPLIKRLADLALHLTDIEFSERCLTLINTTEHPDIRSSLWMTSISSFIKCFQSTRGENSRNMLSIEKILKGEHRFAMESYEYFLNIRNKHFIHDENSYSQCLVGAALISEENKIHDIICTSFIAQTLEENNWGNLNLLLKSAKKFIIEQMDNLILKIIKELEDTSFCDLFLRDEIKYQVPKIDDVGKTR